MALQYPLTLNFKLVALAPRIFVRDATGRTVLYVHQKTLKLKEHVQVYGDEQRTQQLFEIRADRILDFSARYHIRDMSGRELGSIKHKGLRSIWSSTYEFYNDTNDQPSWKMTEDNPWVKVGDALLGEIPILGMFTGYFLHPSYTVYHLGSDAPVLQMRKEAAFFESTFTITKVDQRLEGEHETRLLLSILMAVQLERSRG